MKRINKAFYTEKIENGSRDYLRLHEDGCFALDGDGTWYEKTTINSHRFDQPDNVKTVQASPEIAEKLESAFQQEMKRHDEMMGEVVAAIVGSLSKLENERGPILYGPSPELLEEMGAMPTDPGWQTEVGMGHLGKD